MGFDGGAEDVCLIKKLLPVGGNKRPAQRDRAIVADEAVPAEEDGEKAEEECGAAAAVQVVDKPAEARVLLAPAQEADDFGRAEVVREQRAQDDIRLRVGRIGEDVRGEPVDVGRERANGSRALNSRAARAE